MKRGLITKEGALALRQKYVEQMADLARIAKEEPFPSGESIWDHVFHGEVTTDPFGMTSDSRGES
jgi:TPP-dependent pyruvate/acetoin dehydrogenase alpha subunit